MVFMYFGNLKAILENKTWVVLMCANSLIHCCKCSACLHGKERSMFSSIQKKKSIYSLKPTFVNYATYSERQ